MNLEITVEDITKPAYIGVSPSEIWKLINRSNAGELAYRLKSLKYGDFLRTPYWWVVSTNVKKRAGGRCMLCNSGKKVAAHHRSYDNHGYEHQHQNDLICLCEKCHSKFHKKGRR